MNCWKLETVAFFGSVILVLMSCGQLSGVNSKDLWSLEMSLPEGLRLTDSSSTNAVQLQEQLARFDNGKVFFSDPVRYSDGFATPFFRLNAFGKNQDKTFVWAPDTNNSKGWLFGGCHIQGQQTHCEYTGLLNCLKRQADSSISRSADGAALTSNRSQSLLLEWSTQCGLQGAFRDGSSSEAAFRIESGQIIFLPSPLLSILIFRGIWADYEDAVVQAGSVASLPAVVPCNRSDGACLVSPLPKSSCVGCETLMAGQVYTIFFIEALRQDYSSVRSLLYRHNEF